MNNIKRFAHAIKFCTILVGLFVCQQSWAYQIAQVIADRAVVYADEQMTSPVGFIRKGKKIKVGDIPRNKAQVYPIILAGKMAYIRVLDLDTAKEGTDSDKLVAERFQRNTFEEFKTNYAVYYLNYSSQISLSKENNDIKNKDSINWMGAGIRGGAQLSPRWDFDLLANFLQGKSGEETYRAVEFGGGASLRLFDQGRFKAKLYAQLLAIPFSTYSLGDEFRINGYGFSAGTGLNLSYRMSKRFGIEAFGGFHYMKLSGFDAPKPYQSVDPTFLGSRLGAGLNYQF